MCFQKHVRFLQSGDKDKKNQKIIYEITKIVFNFVVIIVIFCL